MHDLQRLLDAHFMRRAGLLKAAAGLSELHRIISGANGDRARLTRRLRDAGDELALLPEMQLVRLMDVIRDVMAGDVTLPADLARDLESLTSGETPNAQLGLAAGDDSRGGEIALDRAARWRAWGNDPARHHAERRAAAVVAMSYAALAAEAGSR
jgi:hypothetical protein